MNSEETEIDRLGWMKSDAFALLGWDTPDLTESVVRQPLNTRCQIGTRLEGADDLVGFDERGRENLGLDEGGMMTTPPVEDAARPAEGYFSKCALQFMQILFSKYTTSDKNNVNRSHFRWNRM